MAASRVGLLADTHTDFADWPTARPKVEQAFAGVDLILHCGDIGEVALLDELEQTATVRATRSSGDADAQPPRLVDGARVLEVSGVSVGLVFSLETDGLPDSATREQLFGVDVRVLVYGGTHKGSIEESDGVLFVCPGSPTLSERKTVAVLNLSGAQPTAALVEI